MPHPIAPVPTPAPELSDTLAWLREMLDEAPSGVVLLDADGIVRYVNATELLLSARSAAEVVGRDFFRELAPALEGEGIGEHYRSRVRGEGVELESEAILPAGHGKRVARLVIRSHRWAGEPWGVVLVEDRTELSRERERRKQAERLAAVGELAASACSAFTTRLRITWWRAPGSPITGERAVSKSRRTSIPPVSRA